MLPGVPFVFAGGFLWLVAYQLAPIGYELTFSKAVITVILMSICNAFSTIVLAPFIGYWNLLVYFAVCTLIVAAILRLRMRHAACSVLIYIGVFTTASIIISKFGQKPL